ncbi:hypothetical protein U27_00791 [Candidatus Vecturithrix granuli]|uniref:Uncharacterized protein n=1 Tax=Vecturithrix granuli TaxID=1499967 RepID=A0A081C8I8_VECG1|nr:hypothetical protein U27_00791 [Candidatus Vecturithrix granuli]
MATMLSFDNHNNLVILTPKKDDKCLVKQV